MYMSTASTLAVVVGRGQQAGLGEDRPTWVSTVLGDRNSRSQMAWFDVLHRLGP
jgi:hypothetical protein